MNGWISTNNCNADTVELGFQQMLGDSDEYTTHFSLTFWACLELTTPMGLDRSLNTSGSSRSRTEEV